MEKRRIVLLVTAGAVANGIAGCSGRNEPVAETPSAEVRTFALKRAPTPLRVDFLTAELTGSTVIESVAPGSGEVIEPPRLRGTLRLKNTSTDRTARLVGGAIEYLGPDGDPIPLASGRAETGFTFHSYSGERVDPGKDTSQTIDIPFPAAALDGTGLSEMRLRLTYIPTPYRTDVATTSASVATGAGSGRSGRRGAQR